MGPPNSAICFYPRWSICWGRAARRAIGSKTATMTSLALAGGCAMNSVANGKVRRNTSFRRVYVQSAAGDAGGAIGSAFAVWHKLGGARSFVMDHAYWGPQFEAEVVDALLFKRKDEIADAGCK